MNLNLNPKIRNAAIAGVLLTIVSVLNAIINVYPDQSWTPIAAVVVTVLVGYLTPQGTWGQSPPPAVPVQVQASSANVSPVTEVKVEKKPKPKETP